MTADPLARRPTDYRVIRVVTKDIDAAMTEAPDPTTGRPWQSPALGQAQGVNSWFDPGSGRDPRVIGNLSVIESVIPETRVAYPRLLDVGCFGGYLYDWLRPIRAVHYYGIDVQEDVIVAARERHKHVLGNGPNYGVGDLFNLGPTNDKFGPFDIAVCLRVVIHTPWLDRALAELTSVAPIVVVGLRLAEADVAVERLDAVSGRTHWFRHYTERSFTLATPRGFHVRFHRSPGYDTAVITR